MATAKTTKNGAESLPFADFLNVGDYRDFYKSLNTLAKDNFALGLDALQSLVSEEQKIADTQIDYILSLQKDAVSNLKEAVKDVPNNDFIVSSVEQVADAHKEYINLARTYSDKVAKYALTVTKKSTEKAIASADELLAKTAE